MNHELTLAEVRARLEQAMDLPPTDDWLELAEHALRARTNSQRATKLYDISTVGQRIQAAREVMGMSRAQLAGRLGVSRYLIQRYERGTNPLPAHRVPGLCASLGVRREWLLMLSDEGGPPLPREVIRRPHEKRWLKRQAEWKKKKHAEAQQKTVELRKRVASLKLGAT